MTAVPLFDAGRTTGQLPVLRPRARPRIKTAGFPTLPLDMGEFYAADLPSNQLGVMLRLKAHLWLHGTLPREAKQLAQIGRVHARTFARMEEALAPHFDIDENGRWRHYDLEEQRNAEMAKRASRTKAGAAGAARRWGPAGEPDPALVTPGGAPPRAATPELVPSDDPMANAMAHAMDLAGVFRAEFGAAAMTAGLANGMASASPAYGSIDRSNDILSKANDRSNRAGASASDGTGDGMPDAKTDSYGDPDAIADPQHDADRGDADRPDAGISGSPPSLPARSLDEVDDAALIAALRKAGGAKILAMLLNPRDLAPIRVLVADGCELERDVVPAVANFATGLRTSLRSFGAKPIREKAIASRDLAAAAKIAEGTRAGVAPGPFVVEGSPAWRAWLRAKGVRSHFSIELQSDRTQKGWHFPREWPPGWDAARLAEVEAKPPRETTIPAQAQSARSSAGGIDGATKTAAEGADARQP